MDPGSAISLGLGAASLAIQVFDGAVKGETRALVGRRSKVLSDM